MGGKTMVERWRTITEKIPCNVRLSRCCETFVRFMYWMSKRKTRTGIAFPSLRKITYTTRATVEGGKHACLLLSTMDQTIGISSFACKTLCCSIQNRMLRFKFNIYRLPWNCKNRSSFDLSTVLIFLNENILSPPTSFAIIIIRWLWHGILLQLDIPAIGVVWISGGHGRLIKLSQLTQSLVGQ